MVNKSPLRLLAAECSEGKISRAHYVEQRRLLIETLVDEEVPHYGSSQSAEQSILFQELGSAQPDSTDLANALANRGDDFLDTAEEYKPDLHITAPMERVEAEVLPKQTYSRVNDTIPDTSRQSSLTLKLLLVLLLLAGYFLWLR